MITISYVYARYKKKHFKQENKKPYNEKSNTAWLYKINFIPQGLHNLPASFPL